jgi:glycosyltransferase involved in cell wall biosynthesis
MRSTLFIPLLLIVVSLAIHPHTQENPAKLFDEKEIVIIIPSYNNAAFFKQNLDSVFSQYYEDFRVIYIDDNSTDETYKLVQEYSEKNNLWQRLEIIHNQSRRGALANIYDAIQTVSDHSIVVTLDGDDWLPHPQVLERVNYYYQSEDVWMTYGCYMVYPDQTIGAWRPISNAIISSNTFRESEWLSTHLRSFYAKLFKLIKKEDLFFENDFFQVTWDMAFMFPMLEMSAFHSKHIPEIMYVYNQSNPINDFKVRLEMVLKMDRLIRSRKKYEPLAALW